MSRTGDFRVEDMRFPARPPIVTASTPQQGVIASHDPKPTTRELRKKAYYAAGITLEDMIFALWDHLIKSDGARAAAIQKIMDEVDLTIN